MKISNKNANEALNIRDTITSIFATTQQVDKTISILPFKHDNLLPLLSGASISIEEETYNTHFTTPDVDSKYVKFHLYIQSTQKCNMIKFNPFVHSKIKAARV